MLKQVLSSFGALLILITLTGTGVHARQGSMEIRRLENQIMELKNEIRELKANSAEMQKLLQAIAVEILQENAAAVINQSESESCEFRLKGLQDRRSELRTFGFADRHPDIVNLNTQIEVIQQECEALAAAK